MTSTDNHPKCTATRRDGERCQARALPDREFCWAHDPQLAEKRNEARVQGGANRANAVRLRKLVPPRLVDTFDRLEIALTGVLNGDLEPQRATAAATLARAMVAVLTAGELEERLRRVEARQDGDDDDDTKTA